MSFSILAAQREHRWYLNSVCISPPENGGRFHAALTGFVSNFGELEQHCDLLPDETPTPTARLIRMLDHGVAEILLQLKGNFSVLVIQPATGQLWARRDRLGAHSLYFARQAIGSGWVVGNSAAQVFKASGHRFEEDPHYLASFFSLSGETSDGHSAFRNVQTVLPGELIAIEGQRIRRTRPPVPVNELLNPSSENEAIEHFRALLVNSVANCLAESADTAVMLSGGMDSGPIAVIADRLCSTRGSRLIPISWSLRDFPEADESPWIDQVADRLSTPLVRLESSDLLPFSNIAAAPVNPEAPIINPFRPLINGCYQIAAANGCTVILNGNAGDELYPSFPLLYRGYVSHREWRHLFEDLAQTGCRGGLQALWRKPPLRALLSIPMPRRSRQRPAKWLTDYARRHWRSPAIWPPECQDHPLPEYAQQLYGRRMGSGRALEYFQSCKLGVERRDPYDNEELVAFMLNAPFSFSYRHHRSKWIMREAMQGLLPERIRLKRRTGLLNGFYQAGKAANRKAIHSYLFGRQREWQRWADAETVSTVLKTAQNNRVSALLVDRCIGYVNWLQYWRTN